MLDEARDITSDPAADVVVIGAGPAGLTVAAELAAAGAEVLVLEAGGLPYDRDDRRNVTKAISDHARGPQSGTRGSASGEPYFPLRMSRARGLAGSTNALKGHGLRGRPLDRIDFGRRFGVAWPIAYDEFARHLDDAAVYCGMASADDPVDWSPLPLSLGGGRAESLETAPFRHGGRDQFAGIARALIDNDSVRIVIGAGVAGFETDGIGSITGVDVRSLDGTRFRASATHYVLAAGGIDNARLLLSSRPVQYLIGSGAHHIGRSFMEHVHYVPATLRPDSPEAVASVQRLCGDADRWIVIDDATVEAEDLLRVAFLPVPIDETSLDPSVPAFGDLIRMVPFGPFGLRGRTRQAMQAFHGAPQIARAVTDRVRGGDSRSAFALAVMSEQAPDPASRITLSGRTDRFGIPLPHLHWHVGSRDFNDARRSTDLLARELERTGVGKVESLWDRGEERPPVVSGGWHHMGTTRMSADSAAGVVDSDARVHGVGNLSIAGSSVFPTSGYANPTLTLVALAVRLGRHLAAL